MYKITDYYNNYFFYLDLKEAFVIFCCDIIYFGVMCLWFDLFLSDI